MINPETLLVEDFYESHFWNKIKTILFCAVSWDGSFATTGKLLKVTTFQTFKDDNIIKQLKKDYEKIREEYSISLKNNLDIHTINGEFIQQRTKGSKNSLTRAFYAKKDFIKIIFSA